MGNKKLNLKELNITSFVTNLEKKGGKNVLGGGFTDPAVCGPGFTQRPTNCTNVHIACYDEGCSL